MAAGSSSGAWRSRTHERSINPRDDVRHTDNMKVQTRGETLSITGLKELAAANSQSFRDQVRSALTEEQKNIEIDLSETMFVDSCGLGALISLHKAVGPRSGQVRLLHPTPPVRQILELTRMHRIFEIVQPT